MNNLLFWIEKYVAACFVLLLGSTLRIHEYGEELTENVIYAFWHRNMIPLLYFRKFRNIVILISSSKDGELIAGPAHVLGFLTARGSSSRGAISASKSLLKQAKKYSLAITPDGPKGPMKKLKPGLLQLAYLTKLPIVPVDVDIKWEKVFSSWDQFRLPLPFSKVNIRFGEPIYVKIKEEIDEKSAELQKNMYDLEKINKIER